MSEETTQTTAYPETVSPEIHAMVEAGVFYGLRKTKTHPQMKQHVLVNRGGVEIINLQKTAESMLETAGFIQEAVRQGGFPLIVATQPSAQGAALRLADKFKFPYVINRWAGGILTNFKSVSHRIEYFVKLRSDLASGAFDKYTKKERLLLERELNRLKELFEGLEWMTKLPSFLVIIDPVLHNTAAREARKTKIPIVAFANVDVNPADIEYLVPGNDNAGRSVDWFFGKVDEAISSGLATRVESAAPSEPQAAKNEN